MSAKDALLELLRRLKAADYRFVTVTPATHARVLARPCDCPDLRDIFGWNRSFIEADLEPQLLECLECSGTLERSGEQLRSLVRVASLGEDLLLHSAYPTAENDAVFFGPDTYRFVHFLRRCIPHLHPPPAWVVDMGTGSGAGAIAAARLLPRARITGVDLNPAALKLAAINAEAAGITVETAQGTELPSGADLVIANPPYIMDGQRRAYRDGGALLGGEVALSWATQALDAMEPGGTMLLYTGASVVDGSAPLVEALERLCADAKAALAIDEIDPDVFGDELEQPAYAEVERIAVIAATIRKQDA